MTDMYDTELQDNGGLMALVPSQSPDDNTTTPAEIEKGRKEEHEGAKSSGLLGPVCLAVSVVLFGANPSVLFWFLHTKGPPYFNSCNILCAANTIGCVTFAPLFRKDIIWANIRALTWKDWIAIISASMCSNVIGAYFDVQGLSLTTVPTQAILEMLEPVEFLLLSLCLMRGERRSRWMLANSGLIVLGVIIAIIEPIFENRPLHLNIGLFYLLIGGVGFVGAEVIGHLFLQNIPIGIFVMCRVLLGTLFYHVLAIIKEGQDVIEKLYSARLWSHMIWYGLLFVTLGQSAWLTALKLCTSSTISFATSFIFSTAILFSLIILRETPTVGQFAGAGVILLSAVSNFWEQRYYSSSIIKMIDGEDEEKGKEEGKLGEMVDHGGMDGGEITERAPSASSHKHVNGKYV